jgi:hypothetical protein
MRNHGFPCETMDFHWNCRKLHAKPWISIEIAESCMRRIRFPVQLQNAVCENMDFQWNYRRLYAKPLISSEIAESCMRSHRFPVKLQKAVFGNYFWGAFLEGLNPT